MPKLMHTGDIHLGMQFKDYPDIVRDKLIHARFVALDHLVDVANQEHCDFFIVAGDLFDHYKPAIKDLQKAAEILNRFEGSGCLILPGNHDHLSDIADSLWEKFRKLCGPRVYILAKAEPVIWNVDDWTAIFYPAPCTKKLSKQNALGWMENHAKNPSEALHIGIAHGSLAGLSYDNQGTYFPMTEAELKGAGMDLWLLGHAHRRYPKKFEPGHRIFYSGTPEPDGLDCPDNGNAWLIRIDNSVKKTVHAQPVTTNCYRFIDVEVKIRNLRDLNDGFNQLDDGKLQDTVVRINIVGHLNSDEMIELNSVIDSMAKRSLHLKIDKSRLSMTLSPDQIDKEFTRHSLPNKILHRLATNSSDGEALQLAYELICAERDS